MKKNIFAAALLISSLCCRAQAKLSFPFQGGKEVMNRFFKDSISVTPDIIQRKATGMVTFKFTADDKGTIKKIIVYYADDAMLTEPLIGVIKKSNHKWIIPDHEKLHDFIIPFTIRFESSANDSKETQKAMLDFYRNKKPIFSYDQVPLDEVTLLPTVEIVYELK